MAGGDDPEDILRRPYREPGYGVTTVEIIEDLIREASRLDATVRGLTGEDDGRALLAVQAGLVHLQLLREGV